MKSGASSPASYVDKARDRMQSHVRHLMEENQALRVCVAELENENAQLNGELALTRTLHDQLQSKLQEIRRESEQRFLEYAKLETVNTNLANLYVASYQLHSTLDRETVLAAIQEIIVNLIGSEEFGVFERERYGEVRLAASVGIAADESILGHERVSQAMATGETWVSAQHGDLTACIPLKIDGDVTGFIVIRRLLSHKAALEPLDLELFDLLATHAAMALHASTLQQRFAAEEAGV
jgi:hypothetical protein